jgi:uncharacterized membrane protein YfcA
VGGLFGVGGAIMAIPILGIFFGLTEQEAQGASLVMVASNVVVALWRYARHRKIDLRLALTLALSAVPFTYVAAHVVTHLPSNTVRIVFAWFLCAIIAYMLWYTNARRGEEGRALLPWPFAGIVGAISGVLSGAFGIGGAMFTVPAMSTIFGLSQVTSQGLALALAVPSSIVGVAAYAVAGDVAWRVSLPLAIGGLITVTSGADVAHKVPDLLLRRGFVCFLIAAALGLFLQGLHAR